MPVSYTTHEVTIGENIYTIRRFQPFVALEILGDLQKQFAGPLAGIIDGREMPRDIDGSVVLNKNSMDNIVTAIKSLSEKLDGKTLRKIAETLIDKECISVAINGADARKLDLAAQGLALESVADIIQLCWEVLKFNYSEVLTRLANPTMLGRLVKK